MDMSPLAWNLVKHRDNFTLHLPYTLLVHFDCKSGPGNSDTVDYRQMTV